MTAFLFVYGTLCFDCAGRLGQQERTRLASESSVIGERAVRGRMVDLGGYPGLVDCPGRVEGLVLRLTRPAVSLAWLDSYEGIGGVHAEYERVTVLTLGGLPASSRTGVPTVEASAELAADNRANGDQAQVVASRFRVWLYRLRNIPLHPRFVGGGRWSARTPVSAGFNCDRKG
ncbi:MAG: gamma-glutamylcyclotransferase [Hyphomicrobiaceae bacterium]|nr:gamma-glutamylcyclotransferase [Hyphomicrobiaceae bacterium]